MFFKTKIFDQLTGKIVSSFSSSCIFDNIMAVVLCIYLDKTAMRGNLDLYAIEELCTADRKKIPIKSVPMVPDKETAENRFVQH
jgi:hypothetical protein